ncbi:HD-GYP domain-containing protein [Anaerobacillus alkaliphilus]|uniref:HD-GYP domain-containing protein n=1 Tax=Anaerobacillus alkaliphilus TaxID=1548597 RepID=A0A4Q0VW55_9BACI|nr:HD-GYP domain-containing protein [Anaerobacillus alkaliphilus]RXJ02853.1 HD-GYP domain-containing protein [Anaerobacillus alkaliphilus]
MRVKPNQLENGCILSSDVFCNSNQTLMRKKTILTEEYINVLQVFLIDAVDVEVMLANGMPFKPKEVIEMEDDVVSKDDKDNTSFMDLYIKAVQTYKKLFQSWQAGSKVDIMTIRKTLLPLLEKLNDNPDELIQIHHYATKNDYIFHHSVSVGVLAAYLGRKLNFSKAEEIQLGIAGMMSDSGMAKIPYSILDKRGVLTSLEFEEIKRHPLYSYQMLKDIPGVTDAVLLAILQHHEREDGSGYPMAYSTKKLHKFSRTIAVVDVFHAMTSERYYKQKQSPYRVIELIMRDDFGKFDIKIVQTLASLIANFSIGTKVRLNNDDIGEVVFIEPHSPIRPMIKIDQSGEFVKLTTRSDLYIEEILKA